MRSLLAKSMVDSVVQSHTANEGAKRALAKMTARVGGDGGGIVLTREGEIGIGFNSRRMAWMFVKEGEIHPWIHHGYDPGEFLTEPLKSVRTNSPPPVALSKTFCYKKQNTRDYDATGWYSGPTASCGGW